MRLTRLADRYRLRCTDLLISSTPVAVGLDLLLGGVFVGPVLGAHCSLLLLVEVGEVSDLLVGEAIELGPLLIGEQVSAHESGQDEIPPVGTNGTCQGQQRPGKDDVNQQRAEAPLPQGEQQAGSQSPHQCGPGPQNHLPGHRAGGEPGPQGSERHGQEHQSSDEGTVPQPDEASQRRRQGQDAQQRGDPTRVAVAGGDPGAPGCVPHLSPATAEQGQRPSVDRAGEQQPGQAVAAQRQNQHHDSAQGPTSTAGQGGELPQLELAGGGSTGSALALLTGAVAAYAPDLGRGDIETPQRGGGNLGVPGEPPSGRLDPTAAAGYRQSRTELVTGERRRLGGEPPHGAHCAENDEPGQQ